MDFSGREIFPVQMPSEIFHARSATIKNLHPDI